MPSLPQSLAYVVTNIRRAEPPADLFEVPTDYTFVRSSIPDDPLITLTPWRQFAPACEPVTRLRPDPASVATYDRNLRS